jgi:hypothetical protein
VTGNQLAARRPARLTSALPGDLPDAAALAGTTASVLCQYDRDRFDPDTLASVAAFHTRSVATATYHAHAVLRICRQYAPPGIRIAGEIDHKAEEPLTLALPEAVRLDGDITVNMAAPASSTRSAPGCSPTPRRCWPTPAPSSCNASPRSRPGSSGLDSLPGVRLVTVREQ